MRKRKSESGKIKNILRKYRMLFLLVAVVAVSGCIVPGGDVFSGMFAPQRPSTTQASADLITTQNLNVIPNPPVSAENAFTVSFEVKNNDEKQEVDNVNIENYDSGKCVQGEVTSTGVGRTSSSASVEKVSDTNVFQFKVTGTGCTGTEDLYADESMPDNIKVCGSGKDYKVKDLGAKSTDKNGNPLGHNIYVLRLTVNGEEIDVPYGADSYTGSDGKTVASYNCFSIKNLSTACSAISKSGITYQAYDKIPTSRTNCIASTGANDVTQCTAKIFTNKAGDRVGGCSNYCIKLNSDCENKCNSNNAYTASEKDSCINQCRIYKYVVKKDINTPCFSIFGYGIPSDSNLQAEKNYVGYDGQCCVCGYNTPKIGTKTTTTVSGTGDTYMPLQTELNEWQFTAPTNDDLGNMPGSCGIKYKITYDFTAKTQASIDVINADKLAQMQRAGEATSSSPTESVGIGPIKVFFDFGASQPVRSGDVLPIFITVEDQGTGLLDTGDVVAGNLKLTIPQDFTEVSCSKFSNSGGEYSNAAAIPMIKKKSPQLRCSFTMPDVTDIKTFYISASLDYTYKLDSEINVAVNPTLVR